MEEIKLEQTSEVVLTYRQADQAEEIKPVVLRYERELPASMRRPAEPDRDEDEWPPRPAQPAPPPMTGPDRPLWQSAIAPPEQAQKGRWGGRLFVGISLLVLLICLGVGLWYVRAHGWPPPETDSRDDGSYHGGDNYPWSGENDTSRKTTIARYPTGGGARLTLTSSQGLPPLTPQEINARVNPATVTVLGLQEDCIIIGTGVIFSSDGYVLTNHHIIAGCGGCTVWVNGQYGSAVDYDAKLVASDPDIDLAVLKIDGKDLPTAQFGVSDELTVGDPAYAIGNPLGTELRNSFTNGMVSYINRDVDVDGVTMTLIQTTAALNSGNSGGPLINQYGQVIGINVIKMMSDHDTIEGLGFAIPSSFAERWVNELIEYGEIRPQPMLGLSIAYAQTTLPDGSTGLRVETVTAGGSGDLAGVQVGDYVTEFNGRRVQTVDEILAIRRTLYMGDEVVIRVCRDGEYLELTMVMAPEAQG